MAYKCDKLAHISYGVWCQYVISYVSEHQLIHAIDTSHTTPTTHVNQGPMLLKLIGWRNCLCFKWVSYIWDHDSESWRWTRPYRKV